MEPTKINLPDSRIFSGLAESRLEISYYIAYYNAERCQAVLIYQSPNHFEISLRCQRSVVALRL
jgi:putative transposase